MAVRGYGFGVSGIEFCRERIGQKIALRCCRYMYRGILASVSDAAESPGVVLTNACFVQATGSEMDDEPQTEDQIEGDVFISFNAVEAVTQTRWVRAPLPGEQGFGVASNG